MVDEELHDKEMATLSSDMEWGVLMILRLLVHILTFSKKDPHHV